MKRKFSFAFIFLHILIFVHANNSYYSIVAPGTIQPNSKYSVSVTLHENEGPATIKVGIVGPTYKESKTIDLSPSQTEVVDFDIPKNLEHGSHTLETEGVKGITFKNSTDLIYKPRDPKVYIQTDKAVYKPGDLVQYRVLVLDENTKPAKLEQSIRLGFRDGASNFVKEVKDIKLNKGVFSGEFQLSEQPVLGSWSIQVFMGPDDDDMKFEKSFQVDKYVLPKFSVEIDTEKDIALDDGKLTVTVRSKYTYNKPVKGKATIAVYKYRGGDQTEKVIDILGKGQVEFDIVKDLNISVTRRDSHSNYFSHVYVPPVTILATVTEEQTGNSRNATSQVNVHVSRYNIVVENNVYDYVVNKPFTIRAYVKKLDGSPVQNSKHMAELFLAKDYESNEYKFTSELDKNGMAEFKVIIPDRKYLPINKIIYADQVLYVPSLSPKTETNQEEDVGPLKLVLKSDNLKLNEDVHVEVKSGKPIPYYVYAIVARGNIIKQEHVKLPKNVKIHEIIFKPSFEMIPESHLYVYFVQDGDLKFDELTLNFPKEFQNKIEITAPKQVKPSDEVTLNIKSDPDSFVGLLGVDQSVLLLQSGNDLSSKDIMKGLEDYNTKTPYIRGYGKYPGQTSGLVTLTNANYPFRNDFYILYDNILQFSIGIEAVAFGNMPEAVFDLEVASFNTIAIDTPIRKNFVETWIFHSLNSTNENGMVSLKKKIPDTITSWVVTGFAMNDKTGFGLVQNPTKIEVFQPFFVSTNLPYSVKRGEVIAIPVVVFNYMDKALDAEITMENDENEYDFTEVSNEVEELVLPDKQRVKRVSVPSNDGRSISFMIRPNKVGQISLKIKAISALAGDAIDQKLKVEPEGVTHYENEAIFITPTDANKKLSLKANIPQDAVLDSEYLEFSIVGDLLGPTVKNIDKLVRMPYGCGEQNMINFVPNILVLNYLEATKKDVTKVLAKAKGFMEVGYQRELTYKHKNGAYSAFGEGSSEANSWLTAYVARYFIQARKYISIDPVVIDKALEYVVSNQLENGQFKLTGHLFHPSHQNNVGFTAFALLALLEDKEFSNKYKSEVEKGLKYLDDNIDKENDTYALAIVALVLKKTDHPAFSKLMTKLEGLAKEENGQKWWTKSSKDHSNDIEITAYILEAYTYTEPVGKLIPIIKWLVSQRNSNGGFDSTQDTVVGLQALIRFAEKFTSGSDGKMKIKFEAQDDEGKETTKDIVTVDKQNSLHLQTHVLPKSTRQVTLEAESEGSSLVQLSYRYNLATKDDKPSFSVKHKIIPTSYSGQLQMEVCADYAPAAGDETKESNMAVMEIYLPSGYTVDAEKFEQIRSAKEVQRIETKNSDTAILIYFDSLTAGQPVCFPVTADRTHAVAKQKPAAITIYDYYKTEQRATVYYEVKSSLCDICDQESECGKCKK